MEVHVAAARSCGGRRTGSERSVMNCRLRLGVTGLYVTGQIQPREEGEGHVDDAAR